MSAPVLSRLFTVQGKVPKHRSHTVKTCPCCVRNSPCGVKQPQISWPLRSETPVPNPQSQSFSQSYGSILPTSLTYFILSTRGCSVSYTHLRAHETGSGISRLQGSHLFYIPNVNSQSRTRVKLNRVFFPRCLFPVSYTHLTLPTILLV